MEAAPLFCGATTAVDALATDVEAEPAVAVVTASMDIPTSLACST
jgi:hypothetical protein